MSRIMSGLSVGTMSVGRRQMTNTALEKLRAKVMMKFVCVAVVCAVMLTFRTWSRLELVRVGYEINDLRQQNRRLGNEAKELSMELSYLKTASRLESIGRNDFGLNYPSPEQTFVLNN